MKFLCTKVKQSWLTSLQNREKVAGLNLFIKDPFIGIEIKNNKPTDKEMKLVDSAVNELFGNHKIAFPVRIVEI
jgi:hypothetical protein